MMIKDKKKMKVEGKREVEYKRNQNHSKERVTRNNN